MKNFIIIGGLLVVSFFSACSRFAQRGETFQQIKIVRVIGKTSLEVLYKGNMIVVDLEGVFIPDERKLESDYFSDGKIDLRYKNMIFRDYALSQNHLSSLVAPGDVMFTEKFINDDGRKVSNIILYSSDMVSINEKMVSDGYAFPVEKSQIKDARLAFRLHRALEWSVNRRQGLWPIGQYLLSKYVSEPVADSPSDKKETEDTSAQKVD